MYINDRGVEVDFFEWIELVSVIWRSWKFSMVKICVWYDLFCEIVEGKFRKMSLEKVLFIIFLNCKVSY